MKQPRLWGHITAEAVLLHVPRGALEWVLHVYLTIDFIYVRRQMVFVFILVCEKVIVTPYAHARTHARTYTHIHLRIKYTR